MRGRFAVSVSSFSGRSGLCGGLGGEIVVGKGGLDLELELELGLQLACPGLESEGVEVLSWRRAEGRGRRTLAVGRC